MKKILIAAGGTGGHLFPAQQLAAQLIDCEVLFAGHLLKESHFFEKEKYPFKEVLSHPLKNGFLKAAFRGTREAAHLIEQFNPDLVVGFGSYHTFPVLLAAVLYRKKLILFEANSVLGKVNRLFRFFASRIACQFPLFLKQSCLVEWLPWKKGEKIDPKLAKIHFGLDLEKKTLLVFGGSQGASFFNEQLPKILAAQKHLQVIHLTGFGQEEMVRLSYQKYGVRAYVKSFERQMPLAYSAADFAICRSGASTIGELIQFELPAILIPYPFATDDHQRKNGEILAKKYKGARIILQDQANGSMLCKELEAIDRYSEKYKRHLRILQEEKRMNLAKLIKEMLL